jgi:hypothetical protein
MPLEFLLVQPLARQTRPIGPEAAVGVGGKKKSPRVGSLAITLQ